ncbi:MAG: cryptochrome/photolyase family protein [Planctomycetota bacterium]
MNLILVLGDQLDPGVASLRAGNPDTDTVLMAEVAEEATYVRHHKKKIAFVFAAMRHFAEELRARGWSVFYTRFDDPGNAGSLDGEVERWIDALHPGRVIVTEPGEYRLKAALSERAARWDVPLEILG